MSALPTVVIQRADADDAWLRFHGLREVLSAARVDEVPRVLRRAAAAADSGLYAAGFLCYEASPAMDAALQTHAPGELPPAWFAIFEDVQVCPFPDAGGAAFAVGEWEPSLSARDYADAVARIRAYLRAGDTYQVNFTFRMHADFEGDPRGLLGRMAAAQQAKCCACIETDQFAVCSASPELFLVLDGDRLSSRPMKGTARRGMTSAEDLAAAAQLRESPKERAENVMIVDMVRNDMGRVARPGSVAVPSLCDTERYPTLWQMTSQVVCRTTAPVPGILRALFPCASITGAPKVRTMQIIRELEPTPRGIYTGAIGFIAPRRRMQFSVAIRTVSIDKAARRAEYGTGSGFVWDSVDRNEYDECLLKAAVLTVERPRFELLETLLWEPDHGYFVLEEHMQRLADSAAYFGYRLDPARVRRELRAAQASFDAAPRRVRLRVAHDGGTTVETFALVPEETRPRRVVLAREPVRTDDPFLYHKTTCRAVYESARGAAPGYDDVLLWNERGEVTESTIANLVIVRGGRRITPPVACGLLAGTFRGRLVREGAVVEEVVSVEDLRRADRIFLVNSVRKWVPAQLCRAGP